MNISQKWAALFHNLLQREQSVTPEIAREGLALIGWISGKWTEIQKTEGYYNSELTLVRDLETVMTALQARSGDAPLPGPWPTDILTDWGLKNPFLSVVSKETLQSEWEPLYEVLRKELSLPDSTSIAAPMPPSAVWVIASSVSLQKAWEKVLRVLLPGDRWSFRRGHSVTALPGSIPTTMKTCLVFGSPLDAQAQAAALELWTQRNGSASLLKVVNTTCVAKAIEKILEHGP